MSVFFATVLRPGPLAAYEVYIWARTLIGLAQVSSDSVLVAYDGGVDTDVLSSIAASGVKLVALTSGDSSFAAALGPIAQALPTSAQKLVITGPETILLPSAISQVATMPPEMLACSHEGDFFVLPASRLAELSDDWARRAIDAPALTDLHESWQPLMDGFLYDAHGKSPASSSPSAICHAGRLDEHGLILKSGDPMVDDRIEEVNTFLKEDRQKTFDNRLYWNFRYHVAPELGSGVGSRGEHRSYKAKILSDLVDRLRPASILDVGCGDLEVTRELAVNDYLGVDISEEALSIAREKRPDWRFLAGDFLTLDLQPADMVICLDVLIHQKDRETYEKIVQGLLRLAKKALVVAAPDDSGFGSQNVVFYYEPISTTIKRSAGGRVEKIGQYREATIALWQPKKRFALFGNR